jgi:hypothetical protein
MIAEQVLADGMLGITEPKTRDSAVAVAGNRLASPKMPPGLWPRQTFSRQNFQSRTEIGSNVD